ncbi:MAG: peptidoglycan/LPS O-acetylase OafA/YrhL/VanZ family protein [Psychroserpens sp.]|jgi:peptidoglycan/LPS O-acetylase OafA/YrhL/VanZ family protein
MRFLLLLTAFLIAYGSIYPFNFDFGSVSGDRLSKLFNFQFYKNSYADILSNFLLFIPLGFLLVKVIPASKSKKLQFLYLNLVGFLMAYLIQVFQLWTPERIPSGGDALWNLFGCIFGTQLAKIHLSGKGITSRSLDGNTLIYLILGIILILLNWSPFVPSLDFGTVKNNLKVLIFAPQLNYFWIFEKLIMWLVCFYFLAKTNLFKMRMSDLGTVVFIVLFVKIFIMDSPLNINHIVGGVSACIVWFMFGKRFTDRFIAILLTLVVVGLSFYPFEFSENVGTFKWLPFSGALNGNILINILAMTKKSIFYACLVWSFYRTSKNLITSTLFVAALVFVCEYLQIFYVQSVAEITDVILVLVAGYILHILLNSNKHITSHTHSIKEPKARFITSEPVTVSSALPIIIGMDGLRAIAALSVFMVHFYQQIEVHISFGIFNLNLWMFNGNTGVALFFILSGFLLSQPFWYAKLNDQQFPNVKQYFLRRAARILPAYYFCLIAVILGKVVFGGSLNFNNLISHFFFLHNLKDYQVLSLNPPFWTLAVEVQFYLLLPLFFFALKRFSFRITLFIFVMAVPAFYWLYVLLMNTLITLNNWPITVPLLWPFGMSFQSATGAALKYSTTTHLPHFLLGVVTSALFIQFMSKSIKRILWPDLIFWATAVSVFVILSTPLDNLLQVEYGRYNFPYVPVLLAIIIFTTPFTLFGKYVLEQPLILWIGRLSYGIYLYHYLVLKGVGRLFRSWDIVIDDVQLIYGLVSLLVTILIAFLSFQFLEKPILHLAKRHQKNSHNMSLITSIGTTDAVNIPQNTVKNKNISSNSKSISNKAKVAFVIVGMSAMLTIGTVYYINQQKASVEQAPWAIDPAATLIFDHHTHTDYSDGELSLEQITELAYFKGCDALAITDHSGVKNSSPVEKFERIEVLRTQYPGYKNIWRFGAGNAFL